MKNITLTEAKNFLKQQLADPAVVEASAPHFPRPPQVEEVSRALMPVPAAAGLPPRPDAYGDPALEFTYRNAQGELLFLVRRYNDCPVDKKIIAWTFRLPLETSPTASGTPESHAQGAWEPRKPDKPWPLYGLDRLAENPEARVLLAEGEKTADAAGKLLEGVGVTTLNGSGSVKHADLTPLRGRDVIVLPDNDGPGRKYALDLILGLKGIARSLLIVDIWSLGWEPGEDVADNVSLSDDFLDQALPVAEWLEQNPEEANVVATQEAATEREAKIAGLAQLDNLEYDIQRQDAAKALGLRVSVLDQAVENRRKELRPPETPLQGQQPLHIQDPVPSENLISPADTFAGEGLRKPVFSNRRWRRRRADAVGVLIAHGF